ncbi:hypothetical protein AB5J72_41820 [Streptomyces sp. CG1]|uniref:hypothetical protein n=1 Tax=Streptomyces sp. CG1 TaxID=1287523 RepID=UPI0034E2B038
MPGWAAALVILLGTGVHTIGELWQAAASFELRYSLAPARAQGQYAGISKLANGLASAAAPSVVGLLCIEWGEPGWCLMGGIFIVTGLLIPYVVRWAERACPEDEVTRAA